MSVRVRLTRVGGKKNPIWRVVVADQRSPRDGRFIETVGHYNPQTEPSTIVLDKERLDHWLARGAQPTNTVKQLVKAHAKGLAADPKTSAAIAAATPATAAPLHTEPATPPSEKPAEPEIEAPREAEEAVAAEVDAEQVAEAEAEPVAEAPAEEAPPAKEAPAEAGEKSSS